MVRSFKHSATLGDNFFMKNTLEEYLIADMIADVPFLTLKERYNFCKAPLNVKMSIKNGFNAKKDNPRFQEKTIARIKFSRVL